MENVNQQQSKQDQSSDVEQQTAVPYIPQSVPVETSPKRFRTPVTNGILLAIMILLGGFMTYNFVGHQLTQLAGVSDVREVIPTPTMTPTVTPLPTSSY